MKNNSFLAMMICFSFLLAVVGCEKVEVQKSLPNDNANIEARGDDCTNCPPEDCCCRVSLNGTTSASLVFCGTTNPEWSATECSVDLVSPCPDISGYYWFTNLSSSSNPDEFFCVAENSSFMIGVVSAANLTLTCQYGQLGAQSINISLGAGEKLYYTADSDCELSECHVEP
jgi:hypothetical protein